MARFPVKTPQDTQRRDTALLSLDRDVILAYLWDTLDPTEYEYFANAPDQSFWRMVHLSRLFIRGLPTEARAESHAWLVNDLEQRRDQRG